jgi:hypothetical protein
MSRTSGVLSWATLLLGAAACAGQELPPVPRPTPPGPAEAPPAAAGQPGPARATRQPPLFPREPFLPPQPAVVDPRTGAWLQVYVPPGECPDLVEMRVGKPCFRCREKLLHPFKTHEWGTHFGRHAQCGATASDEAPPAGQEQAELLPPVVSQGHVGAK